MLAHLSWICLFLRLISLPLVFLRRAPCSNPDTPGPVRRPCCSATRAWQAAALRLHSSSTICPPQFAPTLRWNYQSACASLKLEGSSLYCYIYIYTYFFPFFAKASFSAYLSGKHLLKTGEKCTLRPKKGPPILIVLFVPSFCLKVAKRCCSCLSNRQEGRQKTRPPHRYG